MVATSDLCRSGMTPRGKLHIKVMIMLRPKVHSGLGNPTAPPSSCQRKIYQDFYHFSSLCQKADWSLLKRQFRVSQSLHFGAILLIYLFASKWGWFTKGLKRTLRSDFGALGSELATIQIIMLPASFLITILFYIHASVKNMLSPCTYWYTTTITAIHFEKWPPFK